METLCIYAAGVMSVCPAPYCRARQPLRSSFHSSPSNTFQLYSLPHAFPSHIKHACKHTLAASQALLYGILFGQNHSSGQDTLPGTVWLVCSSLGLHASVRAHIYIRMARAPDNLRQWFCFSLPLHILIAFSPPFLPASLHGTGIGTILALLHSSMPMLDTHA